MGGGGGIPACFAGLQGEGGGIPACLAGDIPHALQVSGGSPGPHLRGS